LVCFKVFVGPYCILINGTDAGMVQRRRENWPKKNKIRQEKLSMLAEETKYIRDTSTKYMQILNLLMHFNNIEMS